MATTGATLITELARRLRDNSNTAYSRDLLRRVLTHTQRAVNMAQRLEKATASFTPSAGRTLYARTEVASDVGRIERIIAEDRPLPEVKWRQLVDESRTWYRDLGSQHRCWARLGGNLFVLTPGILVPRAVSVVYTIVPADVVDGATNVDLADEWLPLVMDLAEAIMLLSARIFGALDGPMSRVSTAMNLKPPTSGMKENT